MAKFYIIGYLSLLFFDTLSQVAFKLGAVATAPVEFSLIWLAKVAHEGWVYIAIMAYLGCFATYMTILRRAPVGPAFAASHLGLVGILFVSITFLHERLSLLQVAGCMLIVSGVVMLGIHESAQQSNITKAG